MTSSTTNALKKIKIVQGDITTQEVDAIVNAANPSLLGGGGVDGAIHRAAGPELREECRKLGGCATGDAKLTKGYKLPAHYVIHTVGPIWKGGGHNEENLLAACYRNTLKLVLQHGIRTIAFPCISTGAYGFPPDRACSIALREISTFIENNPLPETVIIVCFDSQNYQCYMQALKSHKS